jgi:hypothetical protein
VLVERLLGLADRVREDRPVFDLRDDVLVSVDVEPVLGRMRPRELPALVAMGVRHVAQRDGPLFDDALRVAPLD